MGETVDDPDEGGTGSEPLSERFLDLFVYLPTGLAVTVAEELPRLAERGRERFGVQVNSARAVGHFAVVTGQRELKKRSVGLRRAGSTPGAPSGAPMGARSGATPARLRTIPYPTEPEPTAAPEAATVQPTVDAHIPDVATLAIPGFDTLSASQVVQRLDGLSRAELVAVRAYETPTRGRRTILSRVDQLLDERS
jgi:hypothetical protein